MIIPYVDSMLRNKNAYRHEGGSAVIVNIAVTGVNLALKLADVLIPQLSSLGVQGRVATKHVSQCYASTCLAQSDSEVLQRDCRAGSLGHSFDSLVGLAQQTLQTQQHGPDVVSS